MLLSKYKKLIALCDDDWNNYLLLLQGKSRFEDEDEWIISVNYAYDAYVVQCQKLHRLLVI